MPQDKNLAQYVPSAPMVLQSQQDFVAHEKGTKYPFKATQGLGNVFKLVINSQSASVINNAYVFNVELKEAKGDTLRCGLASLIANGAIVGSAVYNVHLNPIIQSKTYDTRTRTITDMIFTGRANIDYVYPVSQIDCNIEVDGDTVRRTNSLTIYFTDVNGARIPATNSFQLCLWLYEAN